MHIKAHACLTFMYVCCVQTILKEKRDLRFKILVVIGDETVGLQVNEQASNKEFKGSWPIFQFNVFLPFYFVWLSPCNSF